jgi:hypothetical protein
MFRKFEENYLKGFGIIPFGDRELINLSWSKHGFNRNPEFGFSSHISNDSGFFLGISIWKMNIWLQIMGKTLEDLDTIDI